MGDPFYLLKGRTIHNLKELGKALQEMDDEEYNHHVNPERNDFANWTENSLGKKETAQKMRKSKNKKELLKTIKEPKKKTKKQNIPEKEKQLTLSEEKKKEQKDPQKLEFEKPELKIPEEKKKPEKPKKTKKKQQKAKGKKEKKKTAKPPIKPKKELLKETPAETNTGLSLAQQRRIVLGKTHEDEERKKQEEIRKRFNRLSTEAPHHFIIKEFLLGLIFGLILGLILVGALLQAGIITY